MVSMDNNPLRYDRWIEEALRGVIRRALSYAEHSGLPGDHHFYITFLTDAEDVVIPTYLHREHPEEMTIILQHQFDSLTVSDDQFEVSLRFNGKLERLCIPFAAISAFSDPSVNFGLQLKMIETDEFEDDDTDFDEEMPDSDDADWRGPPGPPAEFAVPANRSEATEPSDDDDGKTGEVITLDAFRKK